MAAPTIYRSTDTNAPILTAAPSSVIAVLRACLVDGYGSTRATVTITSSGVNVSNNDTVTVDGVTYTFKTALTPAAGEVLIGASAAASLTNLCAAMFAWGVAGTNYATGTTVQNQLQATSVTATVITLAALKGGTAGNSIAISKSAATLTLSGSTFSGGSGSDTTAGLGWTSPYTTTNGRVFKAAGGTQMYLQVLDDASQTGLSRDAMCYGFEAMTAWNTGTGRFPTTAQVAALGCVIRKCGATADSTNKPWMLIGDDRTFYLFILSGDSAGVYMGFSFGDFYSYVSGDAYKCQIQGGAVSQTTARTTDALGQTGAGWSAGTSITNSYLPRNYSGLGASTAFIQVGDNAMPVTAAATNAVGSLYFPNPSDGGMYLCVFRIADGGTPGTTVTGTLNLRGRRRGLYHLVHPTANFADGDTIAGTGAYAGRTFLIVKPVFGTTAASHLVVETTAWDTSS